MPLKLNNITFGKHKIALHVVFWITWIFSFTIIQSLGKGAGEYKIWFLYYVITLPVFVIHTYLLAYWLIPRTFFRGKYLLFGLSVFILLIMFSAAELVISNNFVFRIFAPEKSYAQGYLNIRNIIVSGIGNHFVILVFLAIKAGSSWYKAKNEKEELQQSKLQTEVEIYRYQLQPKLILILMEELEQITENEPEKSPEMIIKISGFLNKLLYETQETLISLHLEIKFIKEFFEIYQLAFENRLVSKVIVNDAFKTCLVPPLLLFHFLENTIKTVQHCNETFESTVIINVERNFMQVTFTLWSENEFKMINENDLEITKNRLNLALPGKYRLSENCESNFREIKLEIFN